MTTVTSTSGSTIVKDSKSGREVLVKGIGALKGKLTISKRVDLTKPIVSSGRSTTAASKLNKLNSSRPAA